MTRSGRSIGDESLRLAEDYAKSLTALEARSEQATVDVLRRSLRGVMTDLKRAYGRYLESAEPDGRDPLGRPIQRSGAAVIRESTARLRSILEIAQDFLTDEEVKGWQQKLERDLEQAQKLGGALSTELAELVRPEMADAFGGANKPAIDAAVRNAGAYLASEGARFREQIVSITGEAAGRGWGPKRMETEVRRALEGAGDPTGKTARMGLRQRAALIARSELANAYVAGHIQNSRRQGFDYVRWIAVKDERTCPYCASRHGQIYPASQVVAPAHPRCRCVLSPVPQEAVELKDGEDRYDLLDQAFWEKSQEQAWGEYAQEKGVSLEKAKTELQRYMRMPTASERRRYPGVLESLMPSVRLQPKKS